jgi:hypothetical protein
VDRDVKKSDVPDEADQLDSEGRSKELVKCPGYMYSTLSSAYYGHRQVA